MKALYFNKKGKAEEVLNFGEIEDPGVSENELKIKMLAAPVNPADFMFIEKEYRVQPSFPQVAGFEGAGIIVDNRGDKNYPNNSLVAFRHKNVWAEYVAVPKTKLVLLPPNYPVEKAAQLSLNPVTAMALLIESGAVKNEWVVLSAGNSAVSKLIIQFAKRKNIKTLAIVRDDSHIEELSKTGASAVVKSDDENILAAIESAVGKDRIAAFLDAVGGTLASDILKIISPFGIIIHYGLFSEQPVRYNSSNVIFKNLVIKGFGIDKWIHTQSASEMEKIWQGIITETMNGDFKMEISGKYLLKDYQRAITKNKSIKTGKTLFWINEQL